MKKNNNKKGFTLTELLIVIVIIGILAGVLIPTFANFIKRANKSAAEQEAVSMYEEWVLEGNRSDAEIVDLLDQDAYVYVNGYVVTLKGGALVESAPKTSAPSLTDGADYAVQTTYSATVLDSKTIYLTKDSDGHYVAKTCAGLATN